MTDKTLHLVHSEKIVTTGERVLRGLIRFGFGPGEPGDGSVIGDPKEYLFNWIYASKHDLDFENEGYQEVWKYLQSWYAMQSCPPGKDEVRAYFSQLSEERSLHAAGDAMEVVDELSKIGKPAVRTGFSDAVDALVEQKKCRDVNLSLRRVNAIMGAGEKLAKPVPLPPGPDGKPRLKTVLKGSEDAIAEMERELEKLRRDRRSAGRGLTTDDMVARYHERSYLPAILTGFDTFDSACDDRGYTVPRIHAFTGLPDAGKTNLMVHLALRTMGAGCPTVFLAADSEGGVGVFGRLVQQLGGPKAGPGVRIPDSVVEVLQKLPYSIMEDDAPLEDAMDMLHSLAKRHPGKPPVLVIDSLNTVWSRGTRSQVERRHAVDELCGQMVAFTRSNKALCLMALEMTKEGQNKTVSSASVVDNKESGSLGHKVMTQWNLYPVVRDGEVTNLVDVGVPKNKPFQKVSFTVEFDPVKCSYREVESQGKEARESKLRDRVFEAVSKNPGVEASERAIQAVLRAGGGRGCRTGLAVRALEALKSSKRVEVREDKCYVVQSVLSMEDCL